MSDASPGVDLGAFLRTMGCLRPDRATTTKIACLLGIDTGVPVVDEDPGPEAPAAPPASPPMIDSTTRVPVATSPPSSAAVDFAIVDVPAENQEQVLVAVRRSGPSSSAVTPVPMRATASAWSPRPMPFEPLLRPIATRAIVGAALAQRSAGGAIDIDRVVDLCARRQLLGDIPRQLRWTIAGRTTVLVDRSPGMAPFTRDATELAERIASVASRDRTEVVRFWGTPTRVGPSPTKTARMVVPPAGTVVVALTHLGIAPNPPARLEDDWLELADRLRSAGCALVVLVPYEPGRWPSRLAARLSIVAWDRTTSVAAVIATVRRVAGASGR